MSDPTPRRLVSLCPSVTELICDLGLADALVGISRFCTHPPEVVEGIEKVGGTKDPRIDRIVDLAPDLVILNEEENRLEDAEALEAAGLRIHCDLPKTVDDTAQMVRRLGAALDRVDQAEAIAADVEQRAERVRRQARDTTEVSWAYLIWRKPWMAVNVDTFVSTLLTLPGGRNVFANASDRYPAVTVDDLVAADPDVVLLASEPFPFEAKHARELAELTGWTEGRFRIVDGQDLSWHGSRTPRGIDYAEEVLAGVRVS